MYNKCKLQTILIIYVFFLNINDVFYTGFDEYSENFFMYFGNYELAFHSSQCNKNKL